MDAKIAVRTNHGAFGQRESISSASKVCKYWKAGKCNRNPCRFLHTDLPPANNVYLRTPKQSNALAKEQPRRTFHYGPKNSLPLGDASENQCTQKFSNHNNHPDVPKNFPKRKTSLVSTTGDKTMKTLTAGFEHNSTLKTSNPVIADAPKNCPKRKTCSISNAEGNTSEDKRGKAQKFSCPIIEDSLAKPHKTKTSLVLISAADAPENKETCPVSNTENVASEDKATKQACVDWMFGTCVKGDECRFFHKWSFGDWFTMLGKIGEHTQAVSGITLPPRCNTILSSSGDGTLHVWDCHTGETTRVINLGDEIGSLLSEGPWTFVGLPNVIKAWNSETGANLDLHGHQSFGQIYAMAVAKDTLFAGAQDGSILVWRGSTENPVPFQLATSLNGHSAAVKCLIVGNGEKIVYSGSMDGTIRVWDVYNLQCVHILNEHTDAVTSLICWDYCLLSCSLDRTIKVWACTAQDKLEVIYTHNLENEAVTLCGIFDAEGKPILCCSCNDNSVYLYDLPSFNGRGRIFSKQEVRTIQTGPDGLFLTGDGAGLLMAWKVTESCGSVPVKA